MTDAPKDPTEPEPVADPPVLPEPDAEPVLEPDVDPVPESDPEPEPELVPAADPEPEPAPEPEEGPPAVAAPTAERLAELAAADEWGMAEALAMAEKGLLIGELPIGAVVVADGEVVGRAFTQEATQGRLLVHAELLALDQADRVVGERRGRAVLYTTLEPCLLCLGAAATVMVERVVFALDSATDGAGQVASLWEAHRHASGLPSVRLPPVRGGVGVQASRGLFQRFIAGRPGPQDPLALWAATLVAGPAPAPTEAPGPVDG